MSDDTPVDRRHLRASDADRDRIASRLRDAHIEGRLRQDEFDRRLSSAFEAQTYGELEPLVRDLPVPAAGTTDPEPVRQPADEPVPSRRQEPADSGRDGMKVAWAVWLSAVLVNLVIWVLVSVSNTELTYFWPIWVAGPWGAVLLGIEIIRRISRD